MLARIGLDVGSASVKLGAILGPDQIQEILEPLAGSPTFRLVSAEQCPTDILSSIIVSECRRTLGNPFQTALDLLREFQMLLPDSIAAVIRVTGSGGRRVADALNLPFENEFKAIVRGVSATLSADSHCFRDGW